MVCRELDGFPVQRGQEGLCEGHLGHDGALEAAVQSIVFGRVRQVCRPGGRRVLSRIF